jgi:hypothetical protein
MSKGAMSRGVLRWFIMLKFHVQELLNIEKNVWKFIKSKPKPKKREIGVCF